MTQDPFSEGTSKKRKLIHPPFETHFVLCDAFEELVGSKLGPPKPKNKRSRAKPVSGH